MNKLETSNLFEGLSDLNKSDRYKTIINNLFGLTDACSDLLIFLSSIMEDDNTVYNNIRVKKQFISYRVGKKKSMISPAHIDRSFRHLVSKNLLINKSKGIYEVNPSYWSKFMGEGLRLNIHLILFERETKAYIITDGNTNNN